MSCFSMFRHKASSAKDYPSEVADWFRNDPNLNLDNKQLKAILKLLCDKERVSTIDLLIVSLQDDALRGNMCKGLSSTQTVYLKQKVSKLGANPMRLSVSSSAESLSLHSSPPLSPLSPSEGFRAAGHSKNNEVVLFIRKLDLGEDKFNELIELLCANYGATKVQEVADVLTDDARLVEAKKIIPVAKCTALVRLLHEYRMSNQEAQEVSVQDQEEVSAEVEAFVTDLSLKKIPHKKLLQLLNVTYGATNLQNILDVLIDEERLNKVKKIIPVAKHLTLQRLLEQSSFSDDVTLQSSASLNLQPVMSLDNADKCLPSPTPETSALSDKKPSEKSGSDLVDTALASVNSAKKGLAGADDALSFLSTTLDVVDGTLRVAGVFPGLNGICSSLRDIIKEARELGDKAQDIINIGQRMVEIADILQALQRDAEKMSEELRNSISAKFEPLTLLILEMREILNNFKTVGWFKKLIQTTKVVRRATKLSAKISTLLTDLRDIVRGAQLSDLAEMISKSTQKVQLPLENAIGNAYSKYTEEGLTAEEAEKAICGDESECERIAKEGGVNLKMIKEELVFIRKGIEEVKERLAVVDVNVVAANEGIKQLIGTNAFFACLVGISHPRVNGTQADLFVRSSMGLLVEEMNSTARRTRLIESNQYPIRLTSKLAFIESLVSGSSEGCCCIVFCSKGVGYSSHDETSADNLIRVLKNAEKPPVYLFISMQYGSEKLAKRIQQEVESIAVIVAIRANILDASDGYEIFLNSIIGITSIHSGDLIGSDDLDDTFKQKATRRQSLFSWSNPNKEVLMAHAFKPSDKYKQSPFELKDDIQFISMSNLFDSFGDCHSDELNLLELLKVDTGCVAEITNNFVLPGETNCFWLLAEKSDYSRSCAVAFSICRTVVNDPRSKWTVNYLCIQTDKDKHKLQACLNLDKKYPTLLWINVESTTTLTFFKYLIEIYHKFDADLGHLNLLLTVDHESEKDISQLSSDLVPIAQVLSDLEIREYVLKPTTETATVELKDPLHSEFKICAKFDRQEGDVDFITKQPYYDRVMRALNLSLPNGCEAVSLYDEDDDGTMVRVNVPSVTALHAMRDLVLMGTFQDKVNTELSHGDSNEHAFSFQVEVSKTQFVLMYEQCILRLNQLTKHQRQKLRDCLDGYKVSNTVKKVHLKAPAGAGKTFVALYVLMSQLQLEDSSTVLFCANNRALAIFVGKWLCEHLSGKGSSKQKKLLGRVRVLCKTMGSSSSSSEKQTPFLALRKYGLENDRISLVGCDDDSKTFSMIVVDEAHHIYSFTQLSETLQQYQADKWLLLSDSSQSSSKGIDFRDDDAKKVVMTEVVRSSQRIVSGALSFQREEDAVEVTCHHKSPGPPLKTLLFKHEKGDDTALLKAYCEKTKAGLESIQADYEGLSLHNRVALVVRDAAFLDKLKPLLENHCSEFEFVSAQEASGVIGGSRINVASGKMQIVLDTITEFDGSERLIVLVIGFDGPVETNNAEDGVLEVRALMYRALTRAHLQVYVINHIVSGGWLEHLLRVKTVSKNDEFDQQKAKNMIDFKAAEKSTVSKTANLPSNATSASSSSDNGTVEELSKRSNTSSSKVSKSADSKVSKASSSKANTTSAIQSQNTTKSTESDDESDEEEPKREEEGERDQEHLEQSIWDTEGNDDWSSNTSLKYNPIAQKVFINDNPSLKKAVEAISTDELADIEKAYPEAKGVLLLYYHALVCHEKILASTQHLDNAAVKALGAKMLLLETPLRISATAQLSNSTVKSIVESLTHLTVTATRWHFLCDFMQSLPATTVPLENLYEGLYETLLKLIETVLDTAMLEVSNYWFKDDADSLVYLGERRETLIGQSQTLQSMQDGLQKSMTKKLRDQRKSDGKVRKYLVNGLGVSLTASDEVHLYAFFEVFRELKGNVSITQLASQLQEYIKSKGGSSDMKVVLTEFLQQQQDNTKPLDEVMIEKQATDKPTESSLEAKTPEEIEAKKLADNGTIDQIMPNEDVTPLTDAACNNELDMVKALLKFGADVNAKAKDGSTPLHNASGIMAHVEVVKVLLATEGIDVNAKNEDGWTALYWASWTDHVEVVKVLLAAEGIDVNAKNKNDQTPLFIGSRDGHVEVVKVLLAVEGIDVNAKDEYGDTPLFTASSSGYVEVVKVLLAAEGIDVNAKNKDGSTPLHWASINGYLEVVKMLLAAEGIDVNTKNKNGDTALGEAISEGRSEIAALLRSAGATE